MGKGFIVDTGRQKSNSPLKKSRVRSTKELETSLLSHFDEIPDPRAERTRKHLLKDIIIIAILAVIAGAEGWEDMENYGISKQQWLEEFLELPNGIPSDDTFRRVFEKLNPQVLEEKLTQWLQQLVGSVVSEVVSIDGKSLRGSYDRNQGVKALHLVSAWANEQRLVLGQVKVEDHSNEITAIPALLELVDITGAIITIDAMGTQQSIVQQLQKKKADYVLSLKANHPTLHSQVKNWFELARATNFEGVDISYDQRLETGHHRREKRQVWAIPVTAFGGLHQQQQWAGLQSIIVVERVRHLWNKTTQEIQFYLSSLPPDAVLNGRVIRQHWGIENQLHWTLDVTWREDQCRVRSFHSPRNFALLRRIALNALNQETTVRRSLRQKVKRAAMNNDYMIQVLNSFCQA